MSVFTLKYGALIVSELRVLRYNTISSVYDYVRELIAI